MNERKTLQERRKTLFIFFFILGIPVFYLGFISGPMIERAGFVYYLMHLTQLKWFIPFHVYWFKWAFIFWGIYALVVSIYIFSIRDMMPGMEYGSIQWGNIPNMIRKYSTPDKKAEKATQDTVVESPEEIGADARRRAEIDHVKAMVSGEELPASGTRSEQKSKAKPKKKNEPVKSGKDSKVYPDRILSKSIRMSYNTHVTRKNLNTVVIGGSGSGKTRTVVLPNLLQGNTSFFALDPKGELLRKTGNAMKELGYKIKVLNLFNMDESDCYNPFSYIRNDDDIQKIVNILFKATGGADGSSTQDPFWDNAAKALLTALISYCWYCLDEDSQNFSTVTELLRMGQIKSEDPEYKSDLDIVFDMLREEVAENDPARICLKFYDDYHSGAARTLQSIMITLSARLNKFNLQSLRRLTATDSLELDKLGTEKTILYAIIPVADDSLNFVVSMLYAQMFERLFWVADTYYNGTLPLHVTLMCDEFANVTLPDNWDRIVSVVRSYNISVVMILQNLAQLKKLFEKDWESIMGNCDLTVYLGGNEKETHKYISELLGKTTIYKKNSTISRGQSGSASSSEDVLGRELMLPEEVRIMNEKSENSIIFIRDELPIKDSKFELTEHPNYFLLADSEEDGYYVHNRFNVPEDNGVSREDISKFIEESDLFSMSRDVDCYSSDEIYRMYTDNSS